MKIEPIKQTRHWMADLAWLAKKVNSVINQGNEHEDQIIDLKSKIADLEKKYNDLRNIQVTN